MSIITGEQALASDVARLGEPAGRLTLDNTFLRAIPTVDQLAKTTLYYTHYKGTSLPLISNGGAGTASRLDFSEAPSLSLAAYASGEILDIFAYWTGSAISLTALSWGTASANKGMAITNATNATPIVITAAGHGLTSGAKAYISGVLGNTGANGEWSVTYIDVDTFSLNGSAGNGAYSSGGYLTARSQTCWSAQGWVSVDATLAYSYRTDDRLRYLSAESESIYLGTLKMSALGQCEDSLAKRFVWNAWNQAPRPLQRATAGNLEFVAGGAQAALGLVDGANSLTMLAGGYGFVTCSASGLLSVSA